MGDEGRQSRDFAATKARLAEIADAVSDENLSLDNALDLFEEAVALGLRASDLLETDIEVEDQREGGLADGTADMAPQSAGISD